jgi:hypothetical protein
VPGDRSRDRAAWTGIGLSVVAVAVVVGVYEWAYRAQSGDSFFGYYIVTRLGSNTGLDQDALPRVGERIVNLGWYAARVAWFAVPGSLLLLIAAARGGLSRWREPGVAFALATAAAYVAVMSLGNNRAERFIFPAYFAIGVAGAMVALRRWAPAERAAHWIAAREPLGTPVAWLLLFLLTFLTGRSLPRVQL